MKFPIEVEMGGKIYRVLCFTEIGGMSMTGDGNPETDKLCRAQWLTPFGQWKKLRNVNILTKLRQICEMTCFCCGREATHTVYHCPLCDECYQLHVEGNRLAVEAARKGVA